MQTFEALFSLFVFCLLAAQFLVFEEKPIDNSLYRLQLANDVWRALYLKGDFEDFSFNKGNQARDNAEADLKEITEMTGICVFINGEQLTSCRGIKTGEHMITTEKLLIVDGVPQKVQLTLTHSLE